MSIHPSLYAHTHQFIHTSVQYSIVPSTSIPSPFRVLSVEPRRLVYVCVKNVNVRVHLRLYLSHSAWTKSHLPPVPPFLPPTLFILDIYIYMCVNLGDAFYYCSPPRHKFIRQLTSAGHWPGVHISAVVAFLTRALGRLLLLRVAVWGTLGAVGIFGRRLVCTWSASWNKDRGEKTKQPES